MEQHFEASLASNGWPYVRCGFHPIVQARPALSVKAPGMLLTLGGMSIGNFIAAQHAMVTLIAAQ